MGWPVTDRYGLSHAPAGLGFVQDVLNTHPTQHPPVADLVADLDCAQRWLDGALQNWSEETGEPQSRVLITEDDLDKLRGPSGRSDDHAALRRSASASVSARVDPTGRRGWSRAETEAAGSVGSC
jgi:hypothetical protein